MKKIWIIVICFLTLLFVQNFMSGGNLVDAAKKPAKTTAASKHASCKTCHSDFTSVLPQNHPSLKENDLASCISCHAPDFTGKAQKNAFSTRMHTAHLGAKANLDCTACHSWLPGKSFGLIGVKGSWGAPTKDDMKLMKEEFASWVKSNYLDNLHAKGRVDCMGCHGKEFPKADATVENNRCLGCHGPMEQLAKKTEPKDFPDRNPHKSHLGEIACTVCHKGHAESKTYCLDCHQLFKMKKIPGGGASQ